MIDNGAAPGSYWMTGSQPFQLMELAQESLAGRAAILNMHSLSQSEIYGGKHGEPFTVELQKLQDRITDKQPIETAEQYERIWKGSLPGYISGQFPQRDIFYSSYMQTYISRDIHAMQDDIDALLFSDFIRAAACRAGQMLNVHDIAQDIGTTDDTARRWLRLLEKSGVIFFIRPYSNNLLKRTIKTPKMYFFDTGLVCYLTKYSSPEILMNGAINGTILENYVISEIIKSYHNNGMEAILHYYRDKDKKEIDIIMERDGELHPIEIKKAASPSIELARTFKLLDKASLRRGTGAVICTKREFSALDRENMIVPAWAI
jgi:predicted AAA+ superfamily ATPase